MERNRVGERPAALALLAAIGARGISAPGLHVIVKDAANLGLQRCLASALLRNVSPAGPIEVVVVVAYRLDPCAEQEGPLGMHPPAIATGIGVVGEPVAHVVV